MAKSKKQVKKYKLNPANFERNLMIVLLVAFLVSAGVLLARNIQQNNTLDIGESVPAIEQSGE
jgi:hypothetical protein